jgi:putative ABC transport system permease protein
MNWWSRLQRRRNLERDLEEELAYHRERRQTGSGDAPPFGNETRIREAMREPWTFHWIETTARDAVYAMRGWRRNPGFAVTAIGSLALGIGAVIAIYSAADALLFRPMPYPEPERLVMVWEMNRKRPEKPHNVISPGNFLDWKARNQVFQDMAAFNEGPTNIADRDRTEQLRAQTVSANFFPLLGVQAFRGRLFTAAEDLASAHQDSVLLISYRLWKNWYGGDPAMIGRQVMVNSQPRTIIGVLPQDFYFRNREVDVWAPIGLDPAEPYRKTSGRYMMAVGRLKRGLELSQAQAQMTDVARAVEAAEPGFDKNWTVMLEPLRDSLVRSVRSSLLLLLAAVGLLLAVACTNVANLLLARYASRRSEMAVRVALGAGRGRLVRQMLTESLLLAVFAGALGILAGHYALAGLVALAPRTLTQSAQASIDWGVVLFAICLSMITGVLFGLAPSLFMSKTDVAPALKQTRKWGSVHASRSRAALITGEIAVSVVLLTGASLFFRSLLRLQRVDPGMNPAGILTFRFSTPAARYTPTQRTQLFAQAMERIGRLPGVVSASAVSYLPFDGLAAGTYVGIGGRPPAKPGEELLGTIRTVMPGYFRTMGIPLRRGRDFTPLDNTPDTPYRFVVNGAFVRKYLPGQEALGTTINAVMDKTNPFGEIVGIVGDVNEGALGKEPVPTVYYPHAHLTYTSMVLLVRSARDPLSLSTPVRRIMRELDPMLPVAEVRTMESVLGETYARERFSAFLLGGFSVSALLLAAIGIYGVLAYSVSERTREIGVRLAIGADAGRIVGMVLGDGARFVLAGMVVGLAGAFAVSTLISSLLFETGPRDPVAFVAGPGILLGVAVVAAYVPAWRASRMDPMKALRVE